MPPNDTTEGGEGAGLVTVVWCVIGLDYMGNEFLWKTFDNPVSAENEWRGHYEARGWRVAEFTAKGASR